jgi:hypothetical protein
LTLKIWSKSKSPSSMPTISRPAQHLSLDAARAQVETADRDRARLVRRHFGQDVANPLDHDLTINTAELSIEAAAEVVLMALQQKLAIKPKHRG